MRLRLTQTDIRNLGLHGNVQEQTNFGSSSLVYRLQSKDDISELSADFSANTITVFIPADFVHNLVNTERVGYDAHQTVSNQNKLFILVEKDFQCLDHTLEDQSDMYSNPNKTC